MLLTLVPAVHLGKRTVQSCDTCALPHHETAHLMCCGKLHIPAVSCIARSQAFHSGLGYWAPHRRKPSHLGVRSDDNEFPLFKALRGASKKNPSSNDPNLNKSFEQGVNRTNKLSNRNNPQPPQGPPGSSQSLGTTSIGGPRKPRPGELPPGYGGQGAPTGPKGPLKRSDSSLSRPAPEPTASITSSRTPRVFPWLQPPPPVDEIPTAGGLGRGPKGPQAGGQQKGTGSEWDVWEAWQPFEKEWSEDWEPWEKAERPAGAPLKYPRRMSIDGRPRDEFLRPIVDFAGIRDRLSPDEISTEERIVEELDGNARDTKKSFNFAARLFMVPLVVGFIISRLLAVPILTAAENFSDQAFALRNYQKIEGAKELREEELRLRMEAAIGRTPPLTDEELYVHLHEEALHVAAKFREYNKQSYLNVVSDSVAGMTFFYILIRYNEERRVLFATIGRVFSGLSDTAKAFIIIAVTDIMLGYHSEDGWTAAIKLVCLHYGSEPEEGPVYAFVAIVPVFLDTCFKYWIFTGLQREDPAAAVTLRSMDRH